MVRPNQPQRHEERKERKERAQGRFLFALQSSQLLSSCEDFKPRIPGWSGFLPVLYPCNPRNPLQQYELRVKRLDVRFDEKLKELHEKATTAGKWKGTAA